MVPSQGQHGVVVPVDLAAVSRPFFALFALLFRALRPGGAQAVGRLKHVDHVQVPHLYDGAHRAHGHQVALDVLSRFIAEPLQGQGEGRKDDVVVNVQGILHVVVHWNHDERVHMI
jgi:hypothetical protein